MDIDRSAPRAVLTHKGQQYDSGIVHDTSPTRSMKMDGGGPLQQISHSPYVSPLPPAVANVPKEDIRGFLHHKRVGNYLLGRTLGEGSFAKVKEGMHVTTGEKVAIKVIDKKKAKDDSYVAKNMRREARLLQSVCHPNIIKLLEVIETDNSYYLVTELCSGGELMQYIYKQNFLEEAEVRKFIRQIVSAVDHLHKANIIHRDLKVENLLLDANMDLRIIDFGLSNVYLTEQEDGTMEQCATQCGSPAYAAPELLGHKSYGPVVDVWSIGVNMYAMLTGRLPFTVEPFNIAALHAKMLDNKMEPIPDQLSSGCKDLMCAMLNPKPDDRITMEGIMKHPWLNVGLSVPFGPSPYPGFPKEEEINQEVLEHMKRCMSVSATLSEIKSCLMNNRAVQSSAVYWLLEMRLKRYIKLHQPKKSKSRKSSLDDGFSEGVVEETIHLPRNIKRTESKKGSRTMRRSNTEKDVTALIKGTTEGSSVPNRRFSGSSRLTERRKSLPTNHIQDDLQKLNLSREEKILSLPRTRTRSISGGNTPVGLFSVPADRANRFTPSTSPGSMDPTLEEGYFISMRRNNSGELNAIRQALGRTVHQAAWTSSRTGSINGSISSSRSNSRPSSHYDCDMEQDELMVSEPGNLQFLRKENGLLDEEPEHHKLPFLPQPPHSAKRKNSSGKPPQRRRSVPDEYEFQSEVTPDAFLSETLRVMSNIKMLEFEMRNSSVIACQFKGVRFHITISRGGKGRHRMHFEWISGGNEKYYAEIRDHMVNMLVL